MRLEWVIIPVFLLVFAGMWWAVITLMARLSGWLELAERYPDRDDPVIERLSRQSGKLGKGSALNPWGGVSYGNCLNLDICLSGLRLSVWRIFGPNCRPIFVPWQEISVESGKVGFFRYFRLGFGAGHLSGLTVYNRTFERIAGRGLLRLP